MLLCVTQLTSAHPTNSMPYRISDEFKDLLVAIREVQLSPEEAKRRFQDIIYRLHQQFPPAYTDSANVQLIFPLKGRNYLSVGGYNGSGFRPRGFDLFNHFAKGSHPAHDIFIRDKNQDSVDDVFGDYVDVVAVSDGFILAVETEWQAGSDYRGGNYVWLYDFKTGGLWYFAHQRKVYVHEGQFVKAGDKLAEVGRTGYNAAAKRSDTHLHLMYLHIESDFSPRPMNTFGWLKNAQTVHVASVPIPVFDAEKSREIIRTIQKKSYQPLPTRYMERLSRKINYYPRKSSTDRLRRGF